MASEATGVSGLAERYAAALFDLADERKALDEVADDLEALRGAHRRERRSAALIRSPVLARDEQARAMAALAERAGFEALDPQFSRACSPGTGGCSRCPR